MDSLLNAGMGYTPMLPMNDPNDPRTDEEKMRDGCMGIIFYVLCVAAFFLLMFLLSSCTTSKNVCDVTTAEGDSLTQYIEQTQQVVKADTEVTASQTCDYEDVSETQNSTQENEEVINEHTVTTTDSLGNSTTTTDRTIKRKSKSQSNRTSETERRHAEEQTALLLSYLDSLAHERNQQTYSHWQNVGIRHSESKTETPKISFWEKIKTFLINCVIFGIVLLGMKIAAITYKKHNL